MMAESSSRSSVVVEASSYSSESSEEESGMGKVSSPTHVSPISLVDKLRAPKLSDIARKRKMRTSPPPVGR